jgi:glycosyltransferase involved in cell wall biosynthesis
LNILWVKAGKLLPLDTGGKIRSFNVLHRLQESHHITLLSYYFGEQDLAYEAEIRRRLPGSVPMSIRSRWEGILGGILPYVHRLPHSAPYAVSKFTDAQVQRLLARWLEENRFDVAVCDFLSASLNFPLQPRIPCLLFQHNVESLLWQRQALHENNPLKRICFRLEAARMIRYESATVRKFHHIIAVSEEDREQMRMMTNASRITVLPTGVDLDRYRANSPEQECGAVVVFLGSMDWEANIDAVEYFCRQIWPRVLADLPSAKFRIVGRNPHARISRLASSSVEVTGTVPSVIEHLRQAAVFVVPLRIGGGTRLKIYEAMAMGKAVVSTTIGVEGLEVHDGENILIADTPMAFAEGVIRVLKDPDQRRQLGAAAARLAARFDWSVVAERFADILEHVAREAKAQPFTPFERARAENENHYS